MTLNSSRGRRRSKLSVHDAFCACRRFHSDIFKNASSSESSIFCENEVKLTTRWLPILDPNTTADIFDQPEEWKRHGLVFRVYKYIGNDEELRSHESIVSETTIKDQDVLGAQHENESATSTSTTYLVSFRHQEGDTFYSSDQWEAMGLWGRNAVQLWSGMAPPNSIVSFLARFIQWCIRSTRRFLFRKDYITLSSRVLLDELQFTLRRTSPKEVIHFEFTGYSMGGALAQIQSIRHGGAPTIVFASNGALDILHDYAIQESQHPKEKNDHIINIFQESDIIPRMDCQPRNNTICTFKQQQIHNILPPYYNNTHENLMYGNGMLYNVFRQSTSSFSDVQESNNITAAFPTLYCRSGHEWNINNNATCLTYSYEKKGSNHKLWDVTWSCFVALLIFLTLSCTKHHITKKSRSNKQKKA